MRQKFGRAKLGSRWSCSRFFFVTHCRSTPHLIVLANLDLIFFRYYECNIKGEVKELLCPDGLVFDDKSQNCDYPSKVKCGARLNLRKLIHCFTSNCR